MRFEAYRIVNTSKVARSARNFVKSNPDASIIYRAWRKAEGIKIIETPKGNNVLNPSRQR